MRYPIFSFEGNDLFVFDTPNDVRVMEVYWIDEPDVLLDSDGRLLTKSIEGNAVELSDSGAEPEPERLRSMLIRALRMRGQERDDNAPSEQLIPTAQATWDENRSGFTDPLTNAISALLRFLRLRKPRS